MTCPPPFPLSNIDADMKPFVLVRVILLVDIIKMERIHLSPLCALYEATARSYCVEGFAQSVSVQLACREQARTA